MKADNLNEKSLRTCELLEMKEGTGDLELCNRVTTDEINQRVKERLKSYIEWTEEVEAALDKSATEEEKKPFSLVLIQKIRNSIAGQFIEDFNPHHQNVTKAEIEENLFVAKYTFDQQEFPACYFQENNFVEELIPYLKYQILQKANGKLSLKRFMKSLNHLRLPFSKVGFIDQPMNYLPKLEVLSLAGNNMSRVAIEWLPPKLRFLELAGNMLSEFNYTSNGPPLIYLGLSYNLFNDRSSLADLSLMKHLVHLDLSENDLSELSSLLECLILIPKLVSLNLKGNPCSLMSGYALLVSRELPNLLYLDGESLNTVRLEDKGKDCTKENNETLYAGKLKIHIFRIMGLPKPKPPKNVRGHFEVVVKLPLLDKTLKDKLKIQIEEEIEKEMLSTFDKQYNIHPEANTNLDNDTNVVMDLKKNNVMEIKSGVLTEQEKPPTVKGGLQEKSKTSLQSKSLWKIGYEFYLSRDINTEDVEGLKSDKLTWNTIMRPKNPVFEVYVPQEEITDLRDTLRTIITLRLYYCEEFKKKKQKANECTRTLVAKIPIPAEIPLWNEDYRGFAWNAKQYCMSKPYPKIAEIKFSTGGKGIVKIGDLKSTVFPPPNYACCHIGLSI